VNPLPVETTDRNSAERHSLWKEISATLGILSYAAWVLVAVAAALYAPEAFRTMGGVDTKKFIPPLIQIIMVGMGATLTPEDFLRTLRLRKAVLTGMVLQFTVMPLAGALLAALFALPNEVAAGVVLIGSCSGGVSSNVMTFLARGDVALSVTMTTISTLMAPVMTPLAMRLLAGRYVPVEFVPMMKSILFLIVIPVLAGLLLNRLASRGFQPVLKVLPIVAMAGICLSISIITSHSRDALLGHGLLLLMVAVLHNATGYLGGYWGARLLKLDEITARTVSIEVGMQNGGMATGLAIETLKSANAALAPALFAFWMNVSASLLASWWRARTPASVR